MMYHFIKNILADKPRQKMIMATDKRLSYSANKPVINTEPIYY